MLISTTDIIKKSVILYTSNFKTILKYILLALIPGALTMAITALMVITSSLINTDKYNLVFLFVPFIFAAFIVVSILGIWFNFALIKEINRLYKKVAPIGVKASLAESKHSIWQGILTSFMVGIISAWPFILTGFLLAVKSLFSKDLNSTLNSFLNTFLILAFLVSFVYLIIYSIKLLFSILETILENQPTKIAIANSQKLVQGRWGAIALRAIVPGFLIYLAITIANSVLSKVFGLFGDSGKIISTILPMVINTLAAPLGAILGIILYTEAKQNQTITETPEIQK